MLAPEPWFGLVFLFEAESFSITVLGKVARCRVTSIVGYYHNGPLKGPKHAQDRTDTPTAYQYVTLKHKKSQQQINSLVLIVTPS